MLINNKTEQETESIFDEIRADRQPIGRNDRRKPFTTHTFEHKPNSTFVLMTDGFADQF
jgi:hypothetical protein